VIDINAAVQSTASETLDRWHASGSDDADPNNEVPEVIDVDQVARQAADSRMNHLWKKWTVHVKKTQQGKHWEQVRLPDPLIEKLETMIKSKSQRAKNLRCRILWRLKLTIHRAARRRRGKWRWWWWRRISEEEEEEAQPTCRISWFLIVTIHRTAWRRRGKRRRRRRGGGRRRRRRSIRRRLLSMTRLEKNPGDRRRSASWMQCEFRRILNRFLRGGAGL
jgi:hypothetical protein